MQREGKEAYLTYAKDGVSLFLSFIRLFDGQLLARHGVHPHHFQPGELCFGEIASDYA